MRSSTVSAITMLARALPGRAIHRRGDEAPRAPLHQPRPSRLRAGQHAGDRQGRALRPLLPLPGKPAAPLPGGVRGRRARAPRSGPSTATRASGPPASTSASSSATATTRSPRSAAPTSPASGSRTSSPRSSSAGAWPPTSSSPPATSPTTTRCPRAPAAATASTATTSSAPSTPRRWTSSSGSTRSSLDAGHRVGGRALAARRRRARARLGELDPRQGPRPAARAPAGLDPEPRRDLRLGPGLRADAAADDGLAPARGARFASMILEELKQVMPSFVSRVERPDRGGEWVAYLENRRDAAERWVERLGLAEREAADDTPVGRAARGLRRRGGAARLVAVRVHSALRAAGSATASATCPPTSAPT